MCGSRKPCVRIHMRGVMRACQYTEMAAFPAGFGYNSAIVAATGQYKCDFRIGQLVNLEGRRPWGDVIEFCANREGRGSNIAEEDGPIVHLQPSFGQIIVQKQLPQITWASISVGWTLGRATKLRAREAWGWS